MNSRPAAPVLTLSPAPNAPAVTGLIEHHLPLVAVLVAQRLLHVPAHVRRDELMSAGMLALVLSARAYDQRRGVSFRCFAAFRIRGAALIDELRSMDWASRSYRSRAREAETVRTQLAASLHRPPGIDDIAAVLGVSARELDAVYADLVRGAVLSLQSLTTDALPETPGNHLDGPESLILRREELGYLHDAVAVLPQRLRFVVVAHFFRHWKMSEIAVEMSVSQSRVSQLCTEAIALIRDGMNSQLDPDTLRSLGRPGRTGVARAAYYTALAERNTVAGRLDLSTTQGEIRRGVLNENVEAFEGSRIA